MKLQKLTTELICADVARSLAFYRDVLGFELTIHVPDAAPFIFARMQNGTVEIDLNQREAVDLDAFKTGPLGGTFSMFIDMEGLDAALQHIQQKSPQSIQGPVKEQFYGMRELTLRDPDGYYIVLAEPIKK